MMAYYALFFKKKTRNSSKLAKLCYEPKDKVVQWQTIGWAV